MENRRSDGKTPEAALNFMREIVPAARQRASDELASIQAVIDKQQGGFSAAVGLGILCGTGTAGEI